MATVDTSTSTQPKYRSDTKGHLKDFISDFKYSFVAERDEDTFFFGTPDEIRETLAYQKFSKWLTDSEMVRAARSSA